MTYTVVWDRAAEAELTRLYVHAQFKKAISEAANRIDAALRVDPQRKGRPYVGSSRVLIDEPLCVVFRIDEPNREVLVQVVWYFPPHTVNGEVNGEIAP